MIQKFNSNNKLLQQLENKRQDILNRLANSDDPVSADIVKMIKSIDLMMYNIVMTGHDFSEVD